MPSYDYFCTALLDSEGHSTVHAIDIQQELVDGTDGFLPGGQPIISKMGSLASLPGEPPPAYFCEEHQGWATRHFLLVGPED